MRQRPQGPYRSAGLIQNRPAPPGGASRTAGPGPFSGPAARAASLAASRNVTTPDKMAWG